MPKRAPTPPPGDDEPKYLTICYPYPPHANMELHGDRLALARWLACCMGNSNDLYAIFHKPSAPNMIVIEVRRDYPDFRRLLGAHKWSEFVNAPGEHGDKVTRIYYSAFATGRAVEKAGWKRIFVVDTWFKDFQPENRYIAYPYPLSSYCDLPSEDQIGFALCRPLPREVFFLRIPAPPPVPVGSANWIAQKELHDIQKKVAVGPAIHAQKGDLQTPTPSSELTGIFLGSESATEPSSYRVYGSTNSTRGVRSSSVNNHGPRHVSRPQRGADASGSSGYNSEASISGIEDYDSSGSVIITGDHGSIPQGYFDGPNIEDEFGTFVVHPTANKDGTPLCPSHGVVCRKGICRDYRKLLRKIETEKEAGKNTGRTNRGSMNAATNGRGLPVGHSRGRDNHNVSRGRNPPRGAGTFRW